MANKNKAPNSKSRGSQKDHQAIPARQQNPESVLIRMVQSNGPDTALTYAKKYGLEKVFNGPTVTNAVQRFFKRKEDRRQGLRRAPSVPTK